MTSVGLPELRRPAPEPLLRPVRSESNSPQPDTLVAVGRTAFVLFLYTNAISISLILGIALMAA